MPKAPTGPKGLKQRQMASDRQVKQDYEGGACSAPNRLVFKNILTPNIYTFRNIKGFIKFE